MQVSRDPRTGVLRLAGRLDVTTVAEVREAVHAAIEEACARGDGQVLVDLHDVEVADATGLGVLVGAHRRAGRLGGRLVLCDVPPRLARLIAATRLGRVLVVAPEPVLR